MSLNTVVLFRLVALVLIKPLGSYRARGLGVLFLGTPVAWVVIRFPRERNREPFLSRVMV